MRTVLCALLVAACGGDDKGADSAAGGAPACKVVVVTDIDETLTTLDSEWLEQVITPTDIPDMRPDADTLMQGYADLGYGFVYLTARGEDMKLADDTPAFDATTAWLHDMGLPDGTLYLATGIGVLGDDAVAHKSSVILDLRSQGYEIAWAYGNADTDIDGYKAADVPNEQIFLVGELAGEMDVNPIPDAEAYTGHLQSHLPTVAKACGSD
jgi:phosphatidate phosphatase PAH1